MHISFRYHHLDFRAPVEQELQHHVPKLGRLLKRFAPDLVQLHGAFDERPKKSEYQLALNLSLPTGTLHASGTGADVRSCVKKAFSELELQLKKHKSKLRKDYEWKRKRPISGAITDRLLAD